MPDTALLAMSASRGAEAVHLHAGLIDWTADKAVELRPVLQTVAITVAILFVVYKAVQSKLSLGTIISTALAAAIFVWLVSNIEQLSDTIGDDLPGGGAETDAPTPSAPGEP